MSAPLRPPGPGLPPATGTFQPAPLTVAVIGAGRVGAVLGAALTAAGHQVLATSAGSPASRDRAARLLPGTAVLPVAEVAALGTDLLLLAVPDDTLAQLVAELAGGSRREPLVAKHATGPRLEPVVAHTSGAHGLAVLQPLTDRGARPLALHPAMTFTGAADDLTRLAGISYGVTAAADLRPFAARLVAGLGGVPEWVGEGDRPLYHAALAHGANHLVTLVNDALDRLRDAGVAQPGRVLAPLLRAALDNTLRLGDAALTGPVSRGDAGTVDRHLDRLAATAPESVPSYLAMARRTADRAIAAGRLHPLDAEELLRVLADRPQAAPAPGARV